MWILTFGLIFSQNGPYFIKIKKKSNKNSGVAEVPTSVSAPVFVFLFFILVDSPFKSSFWLIFDLQINPAPYFELLFVYFLITSFKKEAKQRCWGGYAPPKPPHLVPNHSFFYFYLAERIFLLEKETKCGPSAVAFFKNQRFLKKAT